MSISDSINQFFDRITESQHLIEGISQTIYARVLLHSLLDILARSAYPNVKGNKDRFVRLLDNYSMWDDLNKFSLRQLDYCLSDLKEPTKYPGIERLRAHVQALLHQWPPGKQFVYPKYIEPTTDSLRQLTTPRIIKLIDKVRYPSLLWVTRNFAVHELRHPGHGVDFESRDPTPYYHQFTHRDGHAVTWELYFPLELVSKLVSECASSLRTQFLERSVDPWQIFEPQPNWYAGV